MLFGEVLYWFVDFKTFVRIDVIHPKTDVYAVLMIFDADLK